MKIIYAGVTPYSCPLFDFNEQFSQYALHNDAECWFLPDSPLKLPWQLKEILQRCDITEKVVVHTSSAFGIVAVHEAVVFGSKVKPHIVYMPKYTDDNKEFKRYGKYASQVDVTILTDSAQIDCGLKEWGQDTRLELLLPPAIPATDPDSAPLEGPSFLFQGEITRQNNLGAAIKVLAEHPDMTMTVDGTGKGRWAMPVVRLSRTLSTEPRIRWNSNDRDNIVERVSGNTFVLVFEPNDPWQQVVMASYMGQGAIITARDCDASRQLLNQGKTGILIEEFDKTQLTKAIETDASKLSEISASATDYAKSKLSPNAFFEHLMTIYRSL